MPLRCLLSWLRGRCEDRIWRRDSGKASVVVLLILLFLLIGLFLFSAIAGPGLSAGGCLPQTPEERRQLQARWFKATAVKVEDVTVTGACQLTKTGVLQVTGNGCRVTVKASGPPPRSWFQRIRGAFGTGSRRLTVTPQAATEIAFTQFDDSDPPKHPPRATATLKVKSGASVDDRSTDFSIPRAGALLEIVSPTKCQLGLPDLVPGGRPPN